MSNQINIEIVAACNNRKILERNLLKSPDIDRFSEIHIVENAKSASEAYNNALEECKSDIVAFVHQDVYFPQGWFDKLNLALSQLQSEDPKWAIVGTFGVSSDFNRKGHVYSNGLGMVLGKEFESPIPAQSVDELLIILNKSTNVKFDKELPGFHLYGTDICQTAHNEGYHNYILDLFCIHNSKTVARLGPDFWRACSYVQSKWKKNLPLTTPCITIKSNDIYPLRSFSHWARSIIHKKQLRSPAEDPLKILERLNT